MSGYKHVEALLRESPYLPFARADLEKIERRRCSKKYVLARLAYQWRDSKGETRASLAKSLWQALHEIFDEATAHLPGQEYELRCASLKGEPGTPLSRKIVLDIASADILLFDLAYRNPNVYFELGLAYAFNRKVILLKPASKKILLGSDLLGLTTSTYTCNGQFAFDSNTEKHLSDYFLSVVRDKQRLQKVKHAPVK